MNPPPRSDPAERHAYMRLFYRDWRPTLLGRWTNRAWAWWCGLGLPPRRQLTLQVPGRRSGRLRSNVLVVATHEDNRYLVSMLGDRSEWLLNVRAAGGKVIIKQGRARPVLLTEIPPDERAPILKAYCQVAPSGRTHLPVAHDAPLLEFAAVAADYPVFRIDPA